MSEQLIPDGVELKDAEGRVIHEYRLLYMLGCEDRERERNTFEDPIRKAVESWRGCQCRKVHVMGDIQVAEYHNRQDGDTGYMCFVDGKSISRGAPTLETAYITALCHKHDGINSKAATYITRMLGLPLEEA
jgi:hypothetical protein